MRLLSLNGWLVVKPYTKTKELKTDKRIAGFSMIAAQSGIEPLELLMDAEISYNGNLLKFNKGDQAFFKESDLQTEGWSKQTFKSDSTEGQFVLAPVDRLIFVKTKES